MALVREKATEISSLLRERESLQNRVQTLERDLEASRSESRSGSQRVIELETELRQQATAHDQRIVALEKYGATSLSHSPITTIGNQWKGFNRPWFGCQRKASPFAMLKWRPTEQKALS